MSAPIANGGSPDISHPLVIIFVGPTNMRSNLNPYGSFIGNVIEINGQNTHAFIIDPRYSQGNVMAYIAELGGTVYVPPVFVP